MQERACNVPFDREAHDRRIAERERAAEERQTAIRRQSALDYLRSCLGPRYAPDRVGDLNKYELYHKDQQAVIQQLRDVNLAEMTQSGRGLLFLGTVGAGKDHLLATMLYRALREYEGAPHPGVSRIFVAPQTFDGANQPFAWISGQDLYGKFRDLMDDKMPEQRLVDALSNPTILAISDLIPPIGDPSAWSIAQLYRVIDQRYRAMKPTWATTNALSVDDADAKLTAPIFDRLREKAMILNCFWPSFRERGTR